MKIIGFCNNKQTNRSGELTLELVRNANGTGLDLKESICLAIIHVQKIPDESAGTNKITSTLLGFVQAVGEMDAWKRAEDVSATSEKYTRECIFAIQ